MGMYVLFTCDEWKSRSSQEFMGVFDYENLIKIVRENVENENFQFGRNLKELESMSVKEIEIALKYGYIIPTELNEKHY